jgi:N6-adenosine-specific RNA methylase IME4
MDGASHYVPAPLGVRQLGPTVDGRTSEYGDRSEDGRRRRVGTLEYRVTTKYRTIVADPPWEYETPFPQDVGAAQRRAAGDKRGGRAGRKDVPLPYPSMTVAAIAALPVETLAEDDCRLFLWATNRHLPFAFGIVEAWGFTYRQTLVWHKTNGSPVGSVAPNRAEFLLVGRRGSPHTMKRLPDSVITANPGAHSTKPECFLDYIEAVSPSPRLELFARRQRFSWDTWGNESLEMVNL